MRLNHTRTQDQERIASPIRCFVAGAKNRQCAGIAGLLALLACRGGPAWGQSGSNASGDGASDAPGRPASRQDAHARKPRDKNAPPVYYGPKKRIAVMDMEIKVTAAASQTTAAVSGSAAQVDVAPPGDLGTGLAEMLTTALMHTDRFIVVERKSIADVQAEQTLGGAAGTDTESAAKPGRLLGAQTLVRGAVTEFSTRKSSVGLGGVLGSLSGSHGSAEAVVGIDIRLYDAETGQLVASEHTQGRARSSGTALDFAQAGIKLGGSQFSSSPLGKAARDAIESAVRIVVAKMEARPWESRVADMDGEGMAATLYLSAGSVDGLHVGDELDICHPGEPIIDPQTRLVIGHKKEARIGRCKIVQLTATLATAEVVEGSGFQKKDVARLIAPVPAP